MKLYSTAAAVAAIISVLLMTDNARVLKNDAISEGKYTDPTGLFDGIASPELSDKFTVQIHSALSTTGRWDHVFAIELDGSPATNMAAIISLEFEDTTINPADFKLRVFEIASTSKIVKAWARVSTFSVVETTTTHGFAVNDYVKTTPATIPDTGPTSSLSIGSQTVGRHNSEVARIDIVADTTHFEVAKNPVGTTATQPVDANTITHYVEVESITLSDESNIFLDFSTERNPDLIVLEYQVDTGTYSESTVNIGRLILGEWFQPTVNVQPQPFYPVNTTELIEMADGSFRSDNKSSRKRADITWQTLTQTENLDLLQIFENRARRLDIIYSAFPNDTSNGTTLNGALSGAAVTAVIVDAIPSDTPQTGVIRILRAGGSYTRHAYTAWTTLTYTIASTDFSGDNAADATNVYLTRWEDQHVIHGRIVDWSHNHFKQPAGTSTVPGEWYSSVSLSIEGEVI